MTERLDVIAVGDRLAVVLPADLAARLGATAGGQVAAEALRTGLHDDCAAHDRAMAVAERVMEKYKDALAILAR
jgi:antitoxin component of MazEF toxin-antitoxin module